MRIIFFSKKSKFDLKMKSAEKNYKNVFVSWNIASELVALNCRY